MFAEVCSSPVCDWIFKPIIVGVLIFLLYKLFKPKPEVL